MTYRVRCLRRYCPGVDPCGAVTESDRGPAEELEDAGEPHLGHELHRTRRAPPAPRTAGQPPGSSWACLVTVTCDQACTVPSTGGHCIRNSLDARGGPRSIRPPAMASSCPAPARRSARCASTRETNGPRARSRAGSDPVPARPMGPRKSGCEPLVKHGARNERRGETQCRGDRNREHPGTGHGAHHSPAHGIHPPRRTSAEDARADHVRRAQREAETR